MASRYGKSSKRDHELQAMGGGYSASEGVRERGGSLIEAELGSLELPASVTNQLVGMPANPVIREVLTVVGREVMVSLGSHG